MKDSQEFFSGNVTGSPTCTFVLDRRFFGKQIECGKKETAMLNDSAKCEKDGMPAEREFSVTVLRYYCSVSVSQTALVTCSPCDDAIILHPCSS